jgi:hypothetical protein
MASQIKRLSSLLAEFVRREWVSAFLWAAIGALTSALLRLGAWDRSFQHLLIEKYLPSKSVDDPKLYVPYLAIAGLALALAALWPIPSLITRGLRSWWAGVTSGLPFLFFASTLAAASLRSISIGAAMLCTSFIASFVLYQRRKAHAEDIPDEDDLRVSDLTRSLAPTDPPESDNPITSWTEDALGRASLIDSISVKLLISKSPVLAIFGEFGSGKTSVLNLLREHLAQKAIVVSFSTWLPGSQETLTRHLLSDIASECRKQYVVPGLQKSARRLANALGKSVPLVRTYIDSLPAATQMDDLDSMKAALARLPKRVVVLLDELDGMERNELVSLLKIIRGISALPNLSFVCAANRKALVKTVKANFDDEGNLYFEKFFPVSIQIPEPDPAALRKAGVQRLTSVFNQRGWFDDEASGRVFREMIGDVWGTLISPFCRNLRAVGLLANDVAAAAVIVKREVDPIDLTMVELLRRFKPEAYAMVARNSLLLTGGENLLRGGLYQSDKEKEIATEKFLADLRQATQDDLDTVRGVLSFLFPDVEKISNEQPWRRGAKKQDSERDSPRRISNPGIFPAYFRYQLPEAMFSSVEMESLFREITGSDTPEAIERAYAQRLDSMEKGSLKRDDFLRKLADSAPKSLSPSPHGEGLLRAAMRSAHKYTYDMLPPFAEAGHVLRLVIGVSEEVPTSGRLAVLSMCISEATDDTMALRITSHIPGKHPDFDLEVTVPDIYPSFTKRMRLRYGPSIDASSIDLSSSDPLAFDLWGRINIEGIAPDPEDRRIQSDFWRRYIGNKKSRLAEAFRRFLLPNMVYITDPATAVENKISISDLKELLGALPDDGTLTEADQQSLRTLRRLLDGEFKDGAGPDSLFRD